VITWPIPPGFIRCRDCGEFNGSTEVRHLNERGHEDPEKRVWVLCVCEGSLCLRCGERKVHRSISNSYHDEDGTVGHWAWFAGMAPCAECKAATKP
jgi:hypothetical protein